jgi:hypothetical protein
VPSFKGGVYVNKCNDKSRKYLRISAGPQRGRYVHDLVLEAKIGRELKPGETAEHQDGNGLNVHPENIIGPVFRDENTRMMQKRRKKQAAKEATAI